MGERGQILLKETKESVGIYLYAHWRGYCLKQIVQRALAKKWRWDDTEYLSRIIYDEMIGDEIGTETGFGIGLQEHGDLNYPLLTIYLKDGKIEEEGTVWTFYEFIALDLDNEED